MRQAIKKPKPKQKKSDKIQDWVVVVKDGFINAAINNHNTATQLEKMVSKLEGMGYTVLGYPATEKKIDAIEYVEQMTGKHYKREKRI
jgi:hypothetical protein